MGMSSLIEQVGAKIGKNATPFIRIIEDRIATIIIVISLIGKEKRVSRI